MSLVAGLGLFALALALVLFHLPRRARLVASLLAAAGLGAALFPLLGDTRAPVALADVSYESSPSCLKCHPDHYASWHRSFHRSMTREAGPDTVRGDFSGVIATFYGLPARMYRTGDAYFMETVDPDWLQEKTRAGLDPRTAPERKLHTWKVDLTIGSHNYQQYASRLPGGAVVRLPLAWHIKDKRWIHMNGAFLQPESEQYFDRTDLWNLNCAFCHNVKAQPQVTEASARRFRAGDSFGSLEFDTRVAELGVGCEACHGPGQAHERRQKNLALRYADTARGAGDPSIVNPARLPKERSAQVCGHCHSVRLPQPAYAAEFFLKKDPYTAGDDLERYVHVQRPGDFRRNDSRLTEESNYWADGTMRRASIEYVGLVTSPCYQKGDMTCLSCHTMHGKEPVNQLAPAKETNDACVACHATYADRAALAKHTHHAADSSGSLCYNCHMPNLVWGLLRGMRSHRIVTPRVRAAQDMGMPHACNQCHLDRTLAWTADTVARWYGEPAPAPPLGADEHGTVASLVHLLRGDAGQRALSAWTFGWQPAKAASDVSWAPRFLLLSMVDDYPAVRLAAYRSLKTYPSFADAAFDYLAPPDDRRKQVAALESRLALREVRDDLRAGVSLAPAAVPDPAATKDLLSRQDRREVFISE